MTSIVRGPWSPGSALTPRQVLAKVRAEVPSVEWDALFVGIHMAPGLEDVMGTSKRLKVTVIIEVGDPDVVVSAQRLIYRRACEGTLTAKLRGKAQDVSAIVTEALALCGEATP